MTSSTTLHGTTVICARFGGKVAIAGDGQITHGNTILKTNARKIRKIGGGVAIAGFAGATADALALFERLEGKLEQYPKQIKRAAVELAKDWRTDRYLRKLEAVMTIADREVDLLISGNGDVVESEDGLLAIGSGGPFALAAARAFRENDKIDAATLARKSIAIAAGICIYTNDQILIESM